MPLDPHLILLLHVAATWFMVGLIWLIQQVHYPLFASVGAEHFRDYEVAHTRRITPVVGVAMLTEAATGAALVFTPVGAAHPYVLGGSLALLALIWLSTAFLQVPMHTQLSAGFDAASHRFLVRSNWLRTVAWSARGVLVLYLLSPIGPGAA